MTRRALGGVVPLTALVVAALAAPVAADVINGTNGPDTLVGTSKADTIRGKGGADKLYGKGGRDTLYAGKDHKRDLVYGGPKADRIFSTTYDWVYAGTGNDRITFKPSLGNQSGKHTRIYCGPGDDTVVRLPGYGGLWTYHCEHIVKGAG